MATVDNLTLEINADASKAITSLNKLTTSLNNLKKGLPTKENLEGTAQGLKTLTDQISKLSFSAKTLDKIKAIPNIAKSLSSFKKMGLPTKERLEGTAQGLKVLSDQISKVSLSATNFKKVKALSNIAKNLSAFNSLSPSKIKSTAENLDSLQGAMSHISYQAVEKIERLASAFSKLGEATKNLGGLSRVKKIVNTSAQANPIATTPAESGTTPVESKEAFSQVSNEAKQATKSVGGFWTKFQTVQNMIKSNPISLLASSENAEGMANLSEKVGMSVGALTTLSKVLGWVGIALTAVTFATKIFGKAINLILSPIKKFIQGITTLVKALARIALYRGIRGIIKSISQGLKEGIQNLALYSKALEELDAHSANNVMSRYASEFLYFKNAVATAVIPVLRALIPYVETAINTIIKFINVLAQVGSAIFGTQYTKAKYFWVDYADSLDNANGRAKALKHQLAGFDELNNLTDTNGGSGSDKLQDASQMFEEALIDPKIKNWVDETVNKIKSGLAKIKTTIKPYTDRLQEFFDNFRTKVLPNLKTAKDNLKTIWNTALKPILDSFIKGFFKGLAEGNYDHTIDVFASLSEKVKDATEKLKAFVEKLDMDKVQKFAEKIGFMAGKFAGSITPITNVIEKFNLLYSAIQLVRDYINDKLTQAIKTGIDRFNDIKDTVKKYWEEVKKASDKIITLRDDIINFVNNISVKNLLKDPKTNAENFKRVLDDVKAVIDNLKQVGTIAISIALKLTGLDYVKDSLKNISESAGNLISEDSPMGKVIKAVEDIKTKNAPTDSTKTPKESQYGNYGGYGSLSEYLIAQSKKKASGGFVSRGDLFIANEAGAEMVGSIGGNTAVANNNQITEAIAQATYTAMSQALSENGGSVKIVVEGDGDKMFRVFQKKQREYSRQTGMA